MEDPAEAAALSVPLWDLTLLARHYHPHVAQAARDIAGTRRRSRFLPAPRLFSGFRSSPWTVFFWV